MRPFLILLAMVGCGTGPNYKAICSKMLACSAINTNQAGCERILESSPVADIQVADCVAAATRCSETVECAASSSDEDISSWTDPVPENNSTNNVDDGDVDETPATPSHPTASITITCNTVTCGAGADRSDYTDGEYKSVDCVWTCADYNGQIGKYVSLSAATPYDGGCFEADSEYVSEGFGDGCD